MVLGSPNWFTVDNVPITAAKYDDGEVISYYQTNDAFSTISFNSSSEPDERGVKWTQPFGAIIYRVFCYITFSSLTSDCDIVLYDGDSTTESASISLQPDFCTTASLSGRFLKHPFPRVKLQEGRTYRLVFKPTTTENITINSMVYLDQNSRQSAFGIGHLTYRTNAGAWTDVLTEASQITPIIGEVGTGRIF
jgi:hypothetical protein